jgi:AcrR family transcriptional regulator
VGALEPAKNEMAKDASSAKELWSESEAERDAAGAATGRADAKGAEIMGFLSGCTKQTGLSGVGLVIDRPVCYVKGMAAKSPATKSSTPGPRARLLEAADQLFYEEGIHTVGIDRLIERAGVAKASLYSAFGSKDELIGAYLAARLQRRRERVAAALAKHDTARARLLAVFDVLGERVAEKDFRGCPFVRAVAEGEPNERIDAVCDEARRWVKSLFVELASGAGARKPERLGEQLLMLYDGAVVAAQMDGDLEAPRAARDAAALLVDAATHASGRAAAATSARRK